MFDFLSRPDIGAMAEDVISGSGFIQWIESMMAEKNQISIKGCAGGRQLTTLESFLLRMTTHTHVFTVKKGG